MLRGPFSGDPAFTELVMEPVPGMHIDSQVAIQSASGRTALVSAGRIPSFILTTRPKRTRGVACQAQAGGGLVLPTMYHARSYSNELPDPSRH